MTDQDASGLDLLTLRETFRERIARRFSDSKPIASSFEIIAQAIASGAVEEAKPCEDCDGLGFRALSAARIEVWKLRFAEERRAWQVRAREIEEQARADEENPDWKKIAELRRAAGDQEKRLRYECNRESVCRSCAGTGYVQGDERAPTVPHDSVWTTVACHRCRGQNVAKDGSRKVGTSCGETFPPDDESAEFEDRCPECMGAAYVVPITARPLASPPDFSGDYVVSIDDLPRARRCYSEQPEPKEEPDEAEAFLEELESDAPLLVAAIAILHGPRGDEWRGHHWGRSFALWPLTEAGQKLTEGLVVGFEGDARDDYALRVELLAELRANELQAERSDYRKLGLMTKADDQARKLERKAEQAVRKAEAA